MTSRAAAVADLTGGAAIVKWLERRQVTQVFQVPGESFLPILDGLRTSAEVHTVTNRHEAASAFAAEAYGKVTGRPAVCIVTRGPGAANLSIGLQTAAYDATPLLALIGLTPRSEEGGHAFQEIDLTSTFGSTVKRVLVASTRDVLVATLEQAYLLATTGRPGPVVVGLPTNILYERREECLTLHGATDGSGGEPDITEALAALESAVAPVVLAGTSPVRGQAARSICHLAKVAGIPLVGAWRSYSAVDNDSAEYIGALGLGAPRSVSDTVGSSDCILAFGFAIDQITARSAGFPRPGATVFQFAPGFDDGLVRHVHPSRAVQYVMDPGVAAEALAASLSGRGTSRLAERPARTGERRDHGTELERESSPVQTAVLMTKLNAVLPQDAIVVSDAGNFAQWLLRHVTFGADRVYLGPRNGAMGYAIPGAVGASLAAPGRPCWALCGDGGGLMTFHDLATAAQLRRKVRVVVIDNHAYGTIRARQEQEQPGSLFGTSLGPVDFAAVAAGFGIPSWTVVADGELLPALRAMSAVDGPGLVHVRVPERPLAAPAG